MLIVIKIVCDWRLWVVIKIHPQWNPGQMWKKILSAKAAVIIKKLIFHLLFWSLVIGHCQTAVFYCLVSNHLGFYIMQAPKAHSLG